MRFSSTDRHENTNNEAEDTTEVTIKIWGGGDAEVIFMEGCTLSVLRQNVDTLNFVSRVQRRKHYSGALIIVKQVHSVAVMLASILPPA